MFTTNVRLFSAIYRNGMLKSQLKILTKIKLSVICAHMLNFCRPGHKYVLMPFYFCTIAENMPMVLTRCVTYFKTPWH